jgi:hypothetical protein
VCNGAGVLGVGNGAGVLDARGGGGVGAAAETGLWADWHEETARAKTAVATTRVRRFTTRIFSNKIQTVVRVRAP